MFLLYTNDLSGSLTGSQAILFADDATLYSQNVNCDNTLANDIKSLRNLLRTNHLTLNESKCVQMHIGEKNTINTSTDVLDYVESHKNLGVQIDFKLNFKLHFQYITKNLVYKSRQFFSQKQMMHFYDAYVKYRILYGVLIYGKTSETYLTEIFETQERIIRAINFKHPRDSVFE